MQSSSRDDGESAAAAAMEEDEEYDDESDGGESSGAPASSNLTSMHVFNEFIFPVPNEHGVIDLLNGPYDATQIISKKCFEKWCKSRSMLPKNPEHSFQRTISAHITGLDGRKPFPRPVEAAVLRVIRKRGRWPCFENGPIRHGFRAQGYHEKLIAAEEKRLRGGGGGGGGPESVVVLPPHANFHHLQPPPTTTTTMTTAEWTFSATSSSPTFYEALSTTTKLVTSGAAPLRGAPSSAQPAMLSMPPPPPFSATRARAYTSPPTPTNSFGYMAGPPSLPMAPAGGGGRSVSLNMTPTMGGGGGSVFGEEVRFLQAAREMLAAAASSSSSSGGGNMPNSVWEQVFHLGKRMLANTRGWSDTSAASVAAAERILAQYEAHYPYSAVAIVNPMESTARNSILATSVAAQLFLGQVTQQANGFDPSLLASDEDRWNVLVGFAQALQNVGQEVATRAVLTKGAYSGRFELRLCVFEHDRVLAVRGWPA